MTKGGPEKSRLRFWFKTRDKLLFQDTVERQKQLCVAEKATQSRAIGPQKRFAKCVLTFQAFHTVVCLLLPSRHVSDPIFLHRSIMKSHLIVLVFEILWCAAGRFCGHTWLKEQKNLDQGSVDALHKQLFANHEKVGRASGSASLRDLAGQMIRASAGGSHVGGSFEGKNMDLGNLEEMLGGEDEQQKDKKEADNPEEEVEEQEDEGEGTNTTPKKRKTCGRKGDLDPTKFEAAVTTAVRAIDLGHEKLERSVDTLVVSLQKELQKLEHDSALKAKVKSEAAIAKVRLDTLMLVQGADPKPLSEMIASYSQMSPRQPRRETVGDDNGSVSGKSQGAVERGKAPPCTKYRELITLVQLSALSSGLEVAGDKQDLELAKRGIAAKRKPISDLMASAKQGMTELTRAVKQRQQQHVKVNEDARALAKGGKGGGKSKQGKGKAKLKVQTQTGCSFVITALEQGNPIVERPLGENGCLPAADFHPSRPIMIVADANEAFNETMRSKIVHDTLESFKQTIEAAHNREKLQRSSLTFPDDGPMATAVTPIFDKLLPASDIVSRTSIAKVDQIKPLFSVAAFAMVPDYYTSAGLKLDIATIWMCLEGHRDIVLLRHRDAAKFYTEKSGKAAPATAPPAPAASSAQGAVLAGVPASTTAKFKAAVRTFIMKLSNEETIELCSQVDVYVGTVKPGRCLYVPAGYMFAERADGMYNIGLTRRLLVWKDAYCLPCFVEPGCAASALLRQLVLQAKSDSGKDVSDIAPSAAEGGTTVKVDPKPGERDGLVESEVQKKDGAEESSGVGSKAPDETEDDK